MPWDQVLTKFKAGTLNSGGSGKRVKNRKQAIAIMPIAIMLSEKRAAKAGKTEYAASSKYGLD